MAPGRCTPVRPRTGGRPPRAPARSGGNADTTVSAMSVAADAQPDHGTWRVQLLLAARGGQRAELAGRLVEEAPRLAGLGRVIVLAQLDGDLFPLANPLCRPFDAVLEVQRTGPGDAAPIVDGLDKVLPAVGELIHPDLSGVLAGWPQDVIPCDPTPVRYLYLMRRKAGTSPQQYFDYYFHHHSRFGFKTPAIDGYTQFHVDPEVLRRRRPVDSASASTAPTASASSTSRPSRPSWAPSATAGSAPRPWPTRRRSSTGTTRSRSAPPPGT